MQKSNDITRRDFLKLVPVTLAAASCTDKPIARCASQSKGDEVNNKELKHEPKVDLEPDRQKYLEQIRKALVERALSPTEQIKINLALSDLPLVRKALNELIEKHRGRVLDIVDDVVLQIATAQPGKKPEIWQKIDHPANKLNVYSRAKLVERVKPVFERLISISPTVQKASAKECDENYSELMEQFEKDLTVWANKSAGGLLGLDLDEIQAHVDQYAKENNDMRSDMVINHLPYGSVLEAFQGLAHKVFDLYLQLAHGNKAEVKLPPHSDKSIEKQFLDPKTKRLAFVGHGSWTQIGGMGFLNSDPAHIIATLAMDYKKDPEGFIKKIKEETADAKTPSDLIFGIIFSLSLHSYGKLTGKKDPLAIMMSALGSSSSGLGRNIDKLRFPDEAEVDKDDPRRQKQVFRYTCGSGRYETDCPSCVDDKLRAKIDYISSGLFIAPESTKLFSASHYSFVGKYEAEFMRQQAEGTQANAIRRLTTDLIYCNRRAKQCDVRQGNKYVTIEPQAAVKRLKELKTAPASEFAPEVRERPGFGSSFGEARGYEGLAYLPQYLRDPLMENMGGVENFKLKDEK